MSSTSECISSTVRQRLIEQIVHGEQSPFDLAQEHTLPLDRLAQWWNDPTNSRVLAALAHLSDVRTQMLLARYRANAAVQLIKIATADEPTELSRKACVDLLKADMNVFGRDDREVYEQALDEQAVLEALEELGREPGDERL